MHGEFHERFISAYKRKKRCILQFYKFFENGKYFRIPREESHITVGKYLERLTFQTEFINLFEAIVKTTWQSKQKDLATFALDTEKNVEEEEIQAYHKFARNYAERHSFWLLSHTENPPLLKEIWGTVFEELPTYDQINSGTSK